MSTLITAIIIVVIVLFLAWYIWMRPKSFVASLRIDNLTNPILINELAIFNKDGVQLVPGADFTYSSTAPYNEASPASFPLSAAFDGVVTADKGPEYVSKIGKGPQWLLIELKTPQPISSVRAHLPTRTLYSATDPAQQFMRTATLTAYNSTGIILKKWNFTGINDEIFQF